MTKLFHDPMAAMMFILSVAHVCCQLKIFKNTVGYTETGDRAGRFMDTLYANFNALNLQLEDKTFGN